MAFKVPFLGRLHPFEYITLFVSLILLCLEGVIRLITLALPSPLINFFYRISRTLFHRLTTTTAALSGRKLSKTSPRKKAIVQKIVRASDFVELCEVYGYTAEEHIVQTRDGYLLGLHRLAWKRGEEDQRINAGPDSIQKKVVFCMHGLLMNSEVWVCLTEKDRCLPFALVDQGYDVWFGNNRGNKYSKKATFASPTDSQFWSFSLDDFAFHDIPDSINYILTTTGQPNLAYIGFSQGTAQAFAALSIQPTLNEKVSLFVALAPAMAPPALSSGLVDSLMRASPNFIFLAFGRKAILESTTMWQEILYPPIFVRVIDFSLKFLFGWTASNITAEQKLAAYPHLYSYTSVKSVVHWFQIIRRGRFQMYDDEPTAPWHSPSSRYYQVAKFPTKNIRTPILLVYGGNDGLVDIAVMRRELPKREGSLAVREVPHYEHLDFLWAGDVAKTVFPVVFEALERGVAGMVSSGMAEDISAGSVAAAEFSDAATTAVNTVQSPDHETEDFFEGNERVRARTAGNASGEESLVFRGARRLSSWLVSTNPSEELPQESKTHSTMTPSLKAEYEDTASEKETPTKSKATVASISSEGITVSPARAVGGVSLSQSGEAVSGSGNNIESSIGTGNIMGTKSKKRKAAKSQLKAECP